MKKITKLTVLGLFLICSLCVFAQEKKISVGLGLEFDMDSRHDFAGGAVLDSNYNLPNYLALGFTFAASYNFSNFVSIEPIILLRRYFSKNDHLGFFGEIDAGAFIYFEDGETTTFMPEAGLRGGYRHKFGKSFYVEPYGRLGYPFAFGIGVLLGILF